MTAELKKDDLTKTFFKTFEIEPKYKDYRTKNGKEYECKNPNNRNIRLCYPQITDRHYLELLALCQRKTYEEFKKESLQKIIMIMSNNLYHISQVQELFKGE